MTKSVASESLVKFTRFYSKFGNRLTEGEASLQDLAAEINSASGDSKLFLPWIKLAKFSGVPNPHSRSEQPSLRYDSAIETIFGCEVEHDAGDILFEEAKRLLEDANVGGILYTTPSHKAKAPRWRFLAPFAVPRSGSTDELRDYRRQCVGRLNSILRGGVSVESGTLSQAFVYGRVQGSEGFQVVLLEGAGIDEKTTIEPLGFSNSGPGRMPQGSSVIATRQSLIINELVQDILTGVNWHDSLLRLSSHLAALGVPLKSASELLKGVMLSAEDGSGRWRDRYGDIDRQVQSAIQKYYPRKSDPMESCDDPILHRLADLESELGPIKWQIDRVIEEDAQILIYGEEQTYKSFLAISIACSVATGKAWFGREVINRGIAVYICGEGQNNILRRFKAWCIRHDVDFKDLPVLITTRPVGVNSDGEALAKLRSEISGACKETGLDLALVIVDTLSRNLGSGTDKSDEDIVAFMNGVDEIRRDSRAAAITIHHVGHSHKDRARGSYVLMGNYDARFKVSKAEEAGQLRPMVLKAQKMKDSELIPPMSFRPEKVPLGFREQSDQIATSLVLVEAQGVYMAGNTGEMDSELLRAVKEFPGRGQRFYQEKAGFKSQSGAQGAAKRLSARGLLESDPGGKWICTSGGEKYLKESVELSS